MLDEVVRQKGLGESIKMKYEYVLQCLLDTNST